MQMPDDLGSPASKRAKTDSLDIDLSALNELPECLLDHANTLATSTNNQIGLTDIASSQGLSISTQDANQPPPLPSQSSQSSYLSGLLTSPTTNAHMMQNGMLASSSYPSSMASQSPIYTSQQQLPHKIPSSHTLSTLQQLNNATMGPQSAANQTSRAQPLVSTVRPVIRTQPVVQQQTQFQQQQQQQFQQQQQMHVVAQTSPSAGTPTLITSDPRKRKLITQQLVLLLHAHRCQRPNMDETNANDPNACKLSHCKTMKNALQHMQHCKAGRNCPETHCVSSRQIIAHWRNCTSATCPVCSPLKSANNRNRLPRNGVPAINNGAMMNGGMSNVATFNNSMVSPTTNHALGNNNMADNTKVLGNAVGTSLIRPTTTNTLSSLMQNGHAPQAGQRKLSIGQQQSLQMQQNQMTGTQQLTSPQLAASLANRAVNTSQALMHQQSGMHNSMSSVCPAGSGMALTPQGSTGAAEPINLEDMKNAYAALGLEYKPNSGMTPGAYLQQPVQQQGAHMVQANVSREWQATVNSSLRNHLINKLVSAIFPKPDPLVMNDPRMNNLLAYAKKVEGEMFAVSSSREEYYQRLAEKIYKIRLELKEKRKQRQAQEMQKQAARAMLSSSEDPMMVNTKPDPLHIKAEPTTSQFSNVAGGVSSPSPRSQTSSYSVTKNLLQQTSPLVAKKEPKSPEGNAATPTPTAAAVDKRVVPKKVWSVSELKTSLMPLVNKMIHQEESIFLRQPVDPKALNIPDYFDIIKKPMDLSTIQSKLEDGVYHSPWEFVNDVWLMFENAWLYNKKTSKVHKVCSKLSEFFEAEINVLMKRLGFCCGKKFVFYPNVLVCYGKQSLACTIAQYQVYYAYENRYTFCDKCFEDIKTDMVDLTDEMTGNPMVIEKSKFLKAKNDVLEPEPMVTCRDCERTFHAICVQFLKEASDSNYLCDGCLKVRNQKRKENKYSAKRLPTCKLSTHIEERVNSYLARKNIPGEVLIRVLSFTEKENELKQGMKERFPDICHVLPYKCKAIFAFQYCKQEGRELCFFAMQVQEYDSSAPEPNTSRVYISYLDSVFFFTPRDYRTAVYHEILIGYFDHVRILGYKWGHIWACPPSEGDDYIFHAHPPEQKVPKPKRLQDWYKKMLDKAIIEGVVQDYKDIYKDVVEKDVSSACQLPYFEGDFWTTILEDCIKECQEEEAKKGGQEEPMESEDAEAEDGLAASALQAALHADDNSTPSHLIKPKKQKGNQKVKSLKKNSGRKGAQGSGSDLSVKLFANLEKHKDMFFVLRLKNEAFLSGMELQVTQAISDPDPLISSDLMDARDSFLTMCREKHWEFSSLRRAVYSTMAFLHEIHTTSKDGFVYTCNGCKNQVETRYHCTTCDDFDLCVPCYNKTGHEHKMEKLGLGIEGEESTDSKLSPAETRKRSLQRCIDSLQHASQCKDANCKQSVCEKMKRVVSHTKMCKRKTTGGCPICKQLIALCCYHAKICKENMCSVPFCANIKSKVRMQKMSQRAQQDRMLQRRVALQRGGAMAAAAVSAARPTSQSVPQPGMASQSRPLPTNHPYSTAPTSLLVQQTTTTSYNHSLAQPSQLPHRVTIQQQQHRLVMTNNPPNQQMQMGGQQQMQQANQSQQFIQVQRQQRPAVNSVMAQPIVMNQGVQNVQVVRPLQRPQQLNMHQQGMQQAGQSQAGSAVVNVSEESKANARAKLQQILASLKKGDKTPEEKQKVAKFLKANPQLLQMFNKQRRVGNQGTLLMQSTASSGTQPGTSLLTRVQPQAGSNPSIPPHLLSPGSVDSSSTNAEELSRFADTL